MADHIYTVRVRNANNVNAHEFSGIKANSLEGAIDRAVDMFHVAKSDCTAVEEL